VHNLADAYLPFLKSGDEIVISEEAHVRISRFA